MIPWVRLDAVQSDDGPELRLMQRGAEFSIMLGSNELMNSRLSGSEEALARLAAERLADRPAARMLIGGLGMGFTLRAALASLGQGGRITVAELVPEVIAWARGPMAQVFGGCLDDPRVSLFAGDVGKLIGQTAGQWDAILLDVDNGPEGLTRTGNDALYSAAQTGGRVPGANAPAASSRSGPRRHPAFTWRLRPGRGSRTTRFRSGQTARKDAPQMIPWVAVRSRRGLSHNR